MVVGAEGFSYRVDAKVGLILFDDGTNWDSSSPGSGVVLTRHIVVGGRQLFRGETILHNRCRRKLLLHQLTIIGLLHNHGLRMLRNLSPTLLRDMSLISGLIGR